MRALTLDAYGTLLRGAKEPLLEVCERIVEDKGLDVGPQEFLKLWEERYYDLLGGDFVRIVDANRLSLERLFRELSIDAEVGPYVGAAVEAWARAPAYDDALGALRALEDWPMALVTNADDEILLRALEANGLSFPLIVTSEAVRAYKPHPRPFRVALRALGREPQEVMHIGDSIVDDVRGAWAVGMPVALIDREGSPPMGEGTRPDLILGDLWELVDTLQRWGVDGP